MACSLAVTALVTAGNGTCPRDHRVNFSAAVRTLVEEASVSSRLRRLQYAGPPLDLSVTSQQRSPQLLQKASRPAALRPTHRQQNHISYAKASAPMDLTHSPTACHLCCAIGPYQSNLSVL